MDDGEAKIDLWERVTVFGVEGTPPKVILMFPNEFPTTVSN